MPRCDGNCQCDFMESGGSPEELRECPIELTMHCPLHLCDHLKEMDEETAWSCPNCDESGGQPLYIEGQPMSRWYNGETGDEGCDSFDGCTLCDQARVARNREAEEIAAFYGNPLTEEKDVAF